MNSEIPDNNASVAAQRLESLVEGWNQSSFEAYSQNFTQSLVDHYNPNYFTRLRAQGGRWLDHQYLGSLQQGRYHVHLWRARFEHTNNDVLFSLSITPDGKIAGLLKRSSGV